MTDQVLPLDLGDGLRLRVAAPADADALAAFNGEVHADEPGETDAAMAAWTRDLLTRPHPTFRPELCTIVEEVATGRIASSLNLIPQTWSYGGVELGVGRVEQVGTHPDFRRRGLVRRQMELAHAWSRVLGHQVQAITGIPWYYRQFGYELALDLGGGRRLPVSDIPRAAVGAGEPYRLRPATLEDVPLLLRAADHGRARSLLSSVRDEAWWRYDLAERSAEMSRLNRIWILEETASGASFGYAMLNGSVREGRLVIWACEAVAGVSWVEVAPSLLRALRAIGDAADTEPAAGLQAPAAAGAGDGEPGIKRLVLHLGVEHPLYAALPSAMQQVRPPYAWYVRVPDLPAFLRRVAPALDDRLAVSPAAGYSGDLRLWFYTAGLHLRFADGRLVEATPWPDGSPDAAGACFPPLTFLHLLCGHRSLADLEYAFADCYADADAARALLDALFPRLPSFVQPLG